MATERVFCIHCGAENTHGGDHCVSCGAELVRPAPAGEARVTSEVRARKTTPPSKPDVVAHADLPPEQPKKSSRFARTCGILLVAVVCLGCIGVIVAGYFYGDDIVALLNQWGIVPSFLAP